MEIQRYELWFKIAYAFTIDLSEIEANCYNCMLILQSKS